MSKFKKGQKIRIIKHKDIQKKFQGLELEIHYILNHRNCVEVYLPFDAIPRIFHFRYIEPVLSLEESYDEATSEKRMSEIGQNGNTGEHYDAVNHPKHYTSHPSGVECIDIAQNMGFCLGNAMKYIWRADLKSDAVEDLNKAKWYIDQELKKRAEKTTGIQPFGHPLVHD